MSGLEAVVQVEVHDTKLVTARVISAGTGQRLHVFPILCERETADRRSIAGAACNTIVGGIGTVWRLRATFGCVLCCLPESGARKELLDTLNAEQLVRGSLLLTPVV